MTRSAGHPPPPEGVSAVRWARLTGFQRQVYRAICRIPKGQTRSYQWIARWIGRPKAVRAVGNALNRNPFAPWIPCHRVIRADGGLGGFAQGPAKKREMLSRERRHRLTKRLRRTNHGRCGILNMHHPPTR